MSTFREIGRLLHSLECKLEHEDQCPWYREEDKATPTYDIWHHEPVHRAYLNRAVDLVKVFDTDMNHVQATLEALLRQRNEK